jgi:hypothetical protein
MANQLVYKINSQPSQIEVAKGGVTLYNIGPGQITVSTKTSFLASRTATLSQYFAMPWTSAPLWARSTSEPTLLVIPGQHNIVSPQVTLSGETVNVTGTVHLAPTAKVTIDGNVSLAAGTQVGVSGGQLRTSGGQALQFTATTLLPSDLGTGKNGSVTLSSNATLTSTGEYQTLTIDAGVTLNTAGYIVRAIGTVTVNGTIANNGGAGTKTKAGLGAPTGVLKGGANGVWSASQASSVSGLNAPQASIQGGPGGAANSAAYGGSATPTIAASPTFALLHTGTMGGGASGGVYSSTTGYGTSSGGAGGPILILCATLAGSGTIESLAGTGYINISNVTSDRAGGSGGGPVIVGCRTTTFTGTLKSAGSAGLSTTGTTPQPGGAGTTRLLVAT